MGPRKATETTAEQTRKNVTTAAKMVRITHTATVAQFGCVWGGAERRTTVAQFGCVWGGAERRTSPGAGAVVV
jgi:hypothetical protein